MQRVFNSMVIAGGVMKSLSAIGCVRYLEEVNLIKHIRNFLGTSAGSIMSLFLTLSFSSREIEAFLVEHLPRHDVSLINIDEVFSLVEKLGLNKGKNIEAFVACMLYSKMGVRDATFLDVAKHTGNNLIVCVTNLSKGRPEYWSVDTVPNMSVIKAIRTSCCIPFVFTPITHNNDIYIDGGVLENFPIKYFADSKLGDVIGLNILSKTACRDADNEKEKEKKATNFMDYAMLVFNTITNKLASIDTENNTNNMGHIVTVTLEDYPWVSLTSMQIELPSEQLQQYIKEGYDKTRDTLLSRE
jgi:predicted acylesterase/phospholipase RssA